MVTASKARGARRPGHVSMQQAAALAHDATELRLRGMTYERIGRALGVTTEGARKAVQRGMAEIRTETAEAAEEVRDQEVTRYDRWLERLNDLEQTVDDPSTILAIYDRKLRFAERRAKLLGLDLQRLEVTGANGGPIAIAAIQRVIVDAPTSETLTARVDAALPAQSETAQALRVDADASSENAEITATCDDDNAE